MPGLQIEHESYPSNKRLDEDGDIQKSIECVFVERELYDETMEFHFRGNDTIANGVEHSLHDVQLGNYESYIKGCFCKNSTYFVTTFLLKKDLFSHWMYPNDTIMIIMGCNMNSSWACINCMTQ